MSKRERNDSFSYHKIADWEKKKRNMIWNIFPKEKWVGGKEEENCPILIFKIFKDFCNKEYIFKFAFEYLIKMKH